MKVLDEDHCMLRKLPLFERGGMGDHEKNITAMIWAGNEPEGWIWEGG